MAAAVAAAVAAAAAAGGGGGFGGGRGNITAGPDDAWPQAFNWNSPIRLSPHNPSTVLFAGTRFFISRDRGQTWTMSAPLGKKIDPSKRTLLEKPYSLPNCGGHAGRRTASCRRTTAYVANEYGTIIEIAESPWCRASTGPARTTATSR